MIWVKIILLWLVFLSSDSSPEVYNPPEEPVQPLTWIDIWPEELRSSVDAIVRCESNYNPNAIGDNGSSLGLFQLWRGWFTDSEITSWSDPITNSKVALRVYQTRGRFGGSGGWTCANILGIH